MTLLLEQCEGREHLAWAPTGPRAPMERGHPGKTLPTLLAVSCKKTVFTSCKTGNGYEHGLLQSPNQPSFYRDAATPDLFEQTEGKRGTTGSPPPLAPLSEAEESSRQPGQRATAGGAAGGCCTDTYGKVCTSGCSLPGREPIDPGRAGAGVTAVVLRVPGGTGPRGRLAHPPQSSSGSGFGLRTGSAAGYVVYTADACPA